MKKLIIIPIFFSLMGCSNYATQSEINSLNHEVDSLSLVIKRINYRLTNAEELGFENNDSIKKMNSTIGIINSTLNNLKSRGYINIIQRSGVLSSAVRTTTYLNLTSVYYWQIQIPFTYDLDSQIVQVFVRRNYTDEYWFEPTWFVYNAMILGIVDDIAIDGTYEYQVIIARKSS